jgi:hypothetical protein
MTASRRAQGALVLFALLAGNAGCAMVRRGDALVATIDQAKTCRETLSTARHLMPAEEAGHRPVSETRLAEIERLHKGLADCVTFLDTLLGELAPGSTAAVPSSTAAPGSTTPAAGDQAR